MTERETEIVHKVIEDLDKLGSEKPWKTVGVLARKFGIQESYMRQLLLEYSRQTSPDDLKIRYSHYPSKRNLDMIWAHRKNVQELSRLYDYTRLDEPDQRFADHVEGSPCLFLSHSHKNGDRALYMRDFLLSHGLNGWMSELDIFTGADIFEAIRTGLERCVGIIADVTEESVQSVWVQKEFITSIRQQRKVYVVFDGNNGRLMEALNSQTPEAVMPSLTITSMFHEYFEFLKRHAAETGMVFSYPYVQGEIFGQPLKPLHELKACVDEVLGA